MLDLLSEYLDTATTPEEKNHIAQADRALTRANMEDYEHVIEEILALSDDDDAGVTMVKLLSVFRTKLNEIMILHSITISEDVGLDLLAHLVNGVLDIDNHENPDELISISNEDTPTLEKLCDMLSQTTKYTTDELLHVVLDVSDGFIERLKTINKIEEHEDENTLNERRERIHAFHKYEIYLQGIGGAVPQVQAILHAGINTSMPYSLYGNMIDSRSPVEVMPPKQAARELFAAALISSDFYGTPSEAVKNSLESYISLPNAIAAVMVEVRNLMAGYQS